MISLGDLPRQSDGEPNTPETMVDGLISRRLRIVPSALATMRDALSNNVDSKKSETEIKTPKVDTVPINQSRQGESKFIPENVKVIDYPVHFELEEMANEAREDIDRIFEEAA